MNATLSKLTGTCACAGHGERAFLHARAETDADHAVRGRQEAERLRLSI